MKSRFAPSPTGYLHIGGARTALFAWVFARQQKGKFALRIEDTDLERSSKLSIDAILQSMDWLGLDYDDDVIYQTHRFDRYGEIVKKLLDEDKAYYCNCSKQRLESLREELTKEGKKAKYDNHCRDKNLASGVVRFKNPTNGIVSFDDKVKGKISIANEELDDLIIQRSDNSPTYNLSVVIDDHDMQISCVIRGDDHINNTPKQINLYKALDWNIPQFAHLPMILGSDGSRLSKRHGAISVMSYRDEGYLPEALLNYLARLGWSSGNQEFFTIKEIIKLFNLKNINKSPACFDQNKLLWINQEHIKNSSIDNLVNNLKWHIKDQNIKISNSPDIKEVIEHLKQRSKTLKDMAKQMKMFYQEFDNFDTKLANKLFKNKEPLELLLQKLDILEDWQEENIKNSIKEVCDDLNIGFGKVGQPFRLALSGDGNAGNIDIVANLLGKNKVISRLQRAVEYDFF